jgi:glutamate-1-semialdehyde 2,1-aminomutase
MAIRAKSSIILVFTSQQRPVTEKIIMNTSHQHTLEQDLAWRRRATKVIPGGMYGHQNIAARLPEGYPQFMARGRGSRIWDVDGNEYIDLMCSYGPIILGHGHPEVDAAAQRQQALADCQNGPSTVIVELAERLVERVAHADWAMFAKNGTDATTLCLMIARAGTGRKKILVAEGAYHGSAPWCTPRPDGTTAEDRIHLPRYRYNDLASVDRVLQEHEGDIAGILVSPFRHDAGFDQELADPAFAAGLRERCDRLDAALILDDVRCGFRLHFGSSWEPLGIAPDLSAWSKAIANGYALAAVLGNQRFQEGAGKIFVTGSFWFAGVAMAASIATLEALEKQDALTTITAMGERLRSGLAEQAQGHGLSIRQTGPVQMPYLSFVGDNDYAMNSLFAATAIRNGVYLHPRHNWFLSAAHSEQDIDEALAATDLAFAAVAERYGRTA